MIKPFEFAALPHDNFLAVRASYEPIVLQRLQAQGQPPTEAEASARAMVDSGEKPYAVQNGVAVLPLIGMMSKYSSYWYGGTSVAQLGHAIRLAAADPEVKGYLMVVDSPGGFVSGCSDLMNDVRAAATAKPFDVFVQDLGCSAAFFASAYARKIVAGPTAIVGSLGVISVVADYSEAMNQMGIRIIRLASGKLKAAGAFGTKVTAEQEAMLQETIDGLAAHFGKALKEGRKLTQSQFDAVFDGAEYLAPKAVSLGIVDSIGSLDTAMANLVARIESGADGEESDSTSGRGGFVSPRRQLLLGGKGPELYLPSDPTKVGHLTISANGGGTGPQSGAGTERPSARPRAEGKPSMKNILIRTLAAVGLRQMATAVTVSTSEEPEALVGVLAEQVEAEVRARLENDPLLMACRANGITTAANLQQVLEMKVLGEGHLAELRADAKAEATRAYGGELGPQISAQVDTLPAAAVRSMLASWRKEADAKFGIGKNGEAAQRQTAAKETATAADVDDDASKQAKRAWERLTADQRTIGLRMGMNTQAKQDAWATSVLGEEN